MAGGHRHKELSKSCVMLIGKIILPSVLTNTCLGSGVLDRKPYVSVLMYYSDGW